MKKIVNRIVGFSALSFMAAAVMACSMTEMEPSLSSGEALPSLKADFTGMASSMPETRLITGADGKTFWEGGDGLIVFIAPSGTQEVSRYQYGVTDILEGIFDVNPKNEKPLPSGSAHDWYIVHPYSETAVRTPFGTAGSEFSFDGQRQDFNDPSLHHLTDFDVMTAIMTAVPEGQRPEIHLRHQGVLMRFDLTNGSSDELMLKKLTFQAPQGVHVSGTYYVDCRTGLAPAAATSTAVLDLDNCKLAPGGIIRAYMMMPPFTLKARSNYKVIVDAGDKEFSNTYTLDKEQVFKAGMMYPSTIRLAASEVKPAYDPEVQLVLNKMKSTKTLDSFDFLNENENYRKTYELKGKMNAVNIADPVPSTIPAKVAKDRLAPPEQVDKAFSLTYSFTANAKDEYASLEKLDGDWFTHDFRSDLSFHPLGLAIWVKGSANNKGTFRFILMEDEKMFDPHAPEDSSRNRWQYYAFEDKDILSREGWHQLIMPYSRFKLNKKGTGATSTTPRLDRYTGYIIQVVNTEGEACADGNFCVDELTQITSFKLEEQPARFTSMFVQLHSPEYQYTDWNQEFKDAKAIGIDTWIIQYAQQYDAPDKNISFYKNTNLSWVQTKLDYIDKMFVAAEQENVKIILGLYPGEYTKYNFATSARFKELARKDKQVFDELLALYGKSPSLAGWYITEEFHDGFGPWQLESGRFAMPGTGGLANYLESVASYIKSKSAQPVLVAPALWRGLPADLCGEWFQRLFSRTPSIDFLYLQDCGGRCKADYDVDLPNWYAAIKKACDATGVKFGVDIESFKASPSCPYIGNRSKEWSDLKDQLYVAGLYTEYITNFSWETFKKGKPCYKEYMRHLYKHGLLK